MKFTVLLFALFMLLVSSCNKKRGSDESCQVEDPVNQLPWLKKKVQEYKNQGHSGQVMEITIDDKQYLNIQLMISSCYLCDVHTCNGRQLTYENDSAFLSNIMSHIDEVKVIATF